MKEAMRNPKPSTTGIRWPRTVAAARAMQRRLASRVRIEPLPATIRLVAGLDAAFTRDGVWCVAAAVIWDMERETVVEQQTARRRVHFPYIPGFLSFREAPALLAALSKLKIRPEALMCDGQGLAHPRRFGLACHVGVLAGRPAIGCAKSRLIGDYEEPGPRRGEWSTLRDGRETLGAVLRTRDGVRPVFVSVGHRADLPSALDLVRQCALRYRLPEPTRWADQRCGRTARALES